MAIADTTHSSTDHNFSHSSSGFSLSGVTDAHRDSTVSDCLSEMDLEGGVLEEKLHLGDTNEKDCRICHLSLESGGQENGEAIALGCSCKGDLGAAHKKCAETWFKIKGNTICEICGATALNIAGEQTNEAQSAAASAVSSAPLLLVETRTFWHGRRIMNLLLGCMIFAFVISWLFHFKVLS